MKSYTICPVSDKKTDENVARVNGAFTLLLLLLFVTTHHWLIPAFLAIDFLMRSGDFAKYSLLANSAKSIVNWLPVQKQPINAGPKIFAARIGFTFSILIFVTAFSGLNTVSLVVAGILFVFSFLEAVFGICVACKIYPFVYNALYK